MKSVSLSGEKVSFSNKLGMAVVGNLFVPKSLDRGAPAAAVIVGHPVGAVTEQSADVYAQKPGSGAAFANFPAGQIKATRRVRCCSSPARTRALDRGRRGRRPARRRAE